MKQIVETPHHSRRVGHLPKGCRLCVKGAKLVLLTTGVCARKCWYCPLSDEKKNKDVVVANEWWVKKDQDILDEAKLSSAEGAGITGGDPLCKLDRTIKHIKLLKKRFGKEFHIHLYTCCEHATPKALKKLYDAGLDEIRFHPRFLDQDADLTPIKEALKYSWDVGCEIPVMPGKTRQTKKFIDKINELGVSFINLNQLEVSQTNEAQMLKRGYAPEDDISFAVKGTDNTADKLLKYIRDHTKLRAHYCRVKTKDKVQLRNRLNRRAKNTAKEYDIITGEGLLIRGAAYLPNTLPSYGYRKKTKSKTEKQTKSNADKLRKHAKEIKSKYGLENELLEVDAKNGRILTGAWIIEEIAEELKNMGLTPAVVEEYPTWDQLITDLRLL